MILGIIYFLKKIKDITSYTSSLNYTKFTIGNQTKYCFGKHRSGWKYVVNNLANMISKNCYSPIYLDTFMESTFCWGKNHKTNYFNKPWACFIHNPYNIPHWFQSYQHFNMIYKNKNFINSIPYLKKIIVLSEYNKKFLLQHPIIQKYNIPIYVLYHPTEIPDKKFKYNNFIENNNKKIIQIGWWLRKLHAIFLLPNVKGYRKYALGITDKTPKDMLIKENKYEFKNNITFIKGDVTLLERVSDEEYDKLLSENIVFIDLYDSSANNLVIECIARNTPILINRVGGVEEYLGEEYPFYYSTYKEAKLKLKNYDLIKKTTNYLRTNKKINDQIEFNTFYNGLVEIFR